MPWISDVTLYRSTAALLAGCASILTTQANAQTAPDTTTETQVDEMVVTARRANASINGINVEPLRLPQNVRVLDARLIESLGSSRLDDLIDLSGSVSRQNGFGGLWDNYAIRGFSGDINGGPDLLINRFNANRGFNAQRDVATIELFQVLKGPAGALSGKGEPGGSINIVTKAPQDVFQAIVAGEVGSFDHYRASLDVGGPLSDHWAARLVAVAQDDGSFRDSVESDRLLVAPSIAFRPSETLNFLYQGEYSRVRVPLDRGVVALERVAGSGVLDGLVLPRERYLGEAGRDDTELESFQHQAAVTARLRPGLLIEGGIQYRDGTLFGTASEPTLLIGDFTRRRRQLRDYDFDDLSARLEVAATGHFVGVEHQARIGIDAYDFTLHSRVNRFAGNAANPFGVNVRNPVYGQPLPTLAPQSDTTEYQKGEAIYVQDLITLGDRWSVLLGVRQDRVRQTVRNSLRSTTIGQEVDVTSPRAAVTYKVSDPLSAYVSWGRSFRFNNGTDFAGAAFEPERGRVWEGGIKYALLGGMVNGAVSAFNIEKENILTSDPVNSGFSVAIGRARSRGFEADLNARVGRQFDLTAVFAYVDTEVLADEGGTGTPAIRPGTELSNIPLHSGSVFAQWRSSNSDSGFFTVSGGVTYVGDREGTPSGVATVNSGTGARRATFRLPSYVTAKLGAGYQFTPRLSGRVDVDNLFDEHYLASSFNELWIMPGTPRTVRVSLRADF